MPETYEYGESGKQTNQRKIRAPNPEPGTGAQQQEPSELSQFSTSRELEGAGSREHDL